MHLSYSLKKALVGSHWLAETFPPSLTYATESGVSPLSGKPSVLVPTLRFLASLEVRCLWEVLARATAVAI